MAVPVTSGDLALLERSRLCGTYRGAC